MTLLWLTCLALAQDAADDPSSGPVEATPPVEAPPPPVEAPPPPVDEEPPAELGSVAPAVPSEPSNPVFDPKKERFLERDRRSRGAYRVASAVTATGLAIELVGAATNKRDVWIVGGAIEAVGVPSMAFSSLASAQALGKLTDTPTPAFAWTASSAAGIDLALSLAAAPNESQLTALQRRQLVYVAIVSRGVALVGSVLQQRSNNRIRRKLGLRVKGGEPPKRPSLALSPWLGGRSAGILFTLSDPPGGHAAELPRWTSKP